MRQRKGMSFVSWIQRFCRMIVYFIIIVIVMIQPLVVSNQFNFTLDPILFHKHTQTPFVGWLRVDAKMKDTTKRIGQHVTLTCEITGHPTPTYVWFKRNVTLYDDRDHVLIKNVNWGSRLKLKSTTIKDAGVYTCVGFNNFGRANTSVRLSLVDDLRPEKRVISAKVPKNRKIPPGVRKKESLSDNLDRVSGSKTDKTKQFITSNVVNTMPEIYYPDNEESRHLGLRVCQPYRGSACKRFIANTSVYVRSVFEQGLKEERLTEAFTLMATTYRISRECAELAIPTLCTNVFSPCLDGETSKPRYICADDCRKLEMSVCRRDFEAVRKHQLLDAIIPDCSRLRLNNAACIHIGLTHEPLIHRHTCYNDSGQSYRGDWSTTVEGSSCEQWSSVRPHTGHMIPLQSYPELDENHCRNPGHERSSPWCFIKKKNGKYAKQTCGVPKCKESVISHIENLVYIIVPGITVPALVFLIMLSFCLFRRCQKPNDLNAQTEKSTDPMSLRKVLSKPMVPPKIIPLSSIRFLNELGEGQFGKVYKGEIPGMYMRDKMGVKNDTHRVPVAIKTLKDRTLLHLQSLFERESQVMAALQHPNIVCLMGVCVAEEPVCMVFEYMTFGDLHNFLVSHSPLSDLVADDVGDGLPRVLCFDHMMMISKQISLGMDYLANRGFIHGDLAARNILIGDKISVKISDFGLSRDINTTDYFQVHTKSLLPVRWMPPEAIMYGTFSRESDVWSYGVVLWEIFSYGLQPYYGYSNSEVVQIICERKLLPCPQNCPGEMHLVMLDCWNESARLRPTFKNIVDLYTKWESQFVSMTSTAAWVERIQVQQAKPEPLSTETVNTKNFTKPISSVLPKKARPCNNKKAALMNTPHTFRASLSGQNIPALSMNIIKPPYLNNQQGTCLKDQKGSATESVSSHLSSSSGAGSSPRVQLSNVESLEVCHSPQNMNNDNHLLRPPLKIHMNNL